MGHSVDLLLLIERFVGHNHGLVGMVVHRQVEEGLLGDLGRRLSWLLLAILLMVHCLLAPITCLFLISSMQVEA